MGFREDGKEYLRRIACISKNAKRIQEVQDAIAQSGFWEEKFEWRICTVRTSRIEPVQQAGSRWFRVSVSCDSEMSCLCPSVERAIEYLGVFETLISDLFYTIGWPSWAEQSQLHPDNKAS